MNILTNLDLNNNEVRELLLERLDTPPTDPKEGRIYYDTNLRQVMYYNGLQWIVARTKNISILSEDGGNTCRIVDNVDADNVTFRGIHGDSYLHVVPKDGNVDISLNHKDIPVSDPVAAEITRLETLIAQMTQYNASVIRAAGIWINADDDGNVYVDYDDASVSVEDAIVDQATGDVFIDFNV